MFEEGGREEMNGRNPDSHCWVWRYEWGSSGDLGKGHELSLDRSAQVFLKSHEATYLPLTH